MYALAVPISLGVMAGILGFALGVLLQQDTTYRSMEAAMAEDPYMYLSRQQIYDALKVLKRKQVKVNKGVYNPERTITDDIFNGSDGDHTVKEIVERDSVVGNFVRWVQNSMNVVTMFFTFGLDTRTISHVETTQVAAIMKYGFPGLDDIHIYRNFILSYDRRHRIAHWVCEYLQGKELTSNTAGTIVKPSDYLDDPNIPFMFRANYRDYEHTDWVACQLASPNNYRFDQTCLTETFVMANVVPISRSLKQNIWHPLEAHVRELAIQHGALHVYTGPLFMPQRITFRNWAIRHQVIGVNTVAVPTHFFKVIIVEPKSQHEEPLIEGYVLPNVDVDKNVELHSFQSDIRDIEHFAGLKFVEGTYKLQPLNASPSKHNSIS